MRLRIIAPVVAVIFAAPVAGHAAITQTATYVAGSLIVTAPSNPVESGTAYANICATINDEQRSVGGVCFDRPGTLTKVVIRIADAGFSRVGGTALVHGQDGVTSTRQFCASTTITVATGTTKVEVIPNAPDRASACGATAFGTTGTVTATWS